jgi:hypothetical protein
MRCILCKSPAQNKDVICIACLSKMSTGCAHIRVANKPPQTTPYHYSKEVCAAVSVSDLCRESHPPQKKLPKEELEKANQFRESHLSKRKPQEELEKENQLQEEPTDKKVKLEVELDVFRAVYKHEVKEKYFLTCIQNALKVMQTNQDFNVALCRRIENFEYGRRSFANEDVPNTDAIVTEFNERITDLQNNIRFWCLEDFDWNYLSCLLHYLKPQELIEIKQMLG